MSTTRKAIVTAGTRTTIEQVRAYLPDNYTAALGWTAEGSQIVIKGEDVAGWTLDGYVIPRLASGMVYAHEVPTAQPVYVRLVVVAKVDPETNEVVGYESNHRSDSNDWGTVWHDDTEEWDGAVTEVEYEAIDVAQHYLFQALNVKEN